jgi:hypothetical protein
MSTSDPVFWWYPEETAGLQEIDLSEGLTNLIVTPAIRREDAVGYDGSYATAIYGPEFAVTVILERFGGQSPGSNALERKLQAMVNHLRRGGVVAFSRVRAKSFCGSLSGGITPGFNYAPTFGNAFAAWYAATLAAGDEVAVESGPARNRHEVHAVSSVAGGVINLSDPIVFEHGTGTAASWCRYRDFFPVLYMPAAKSTVDADPITHDARRSWTLRLELRFAPSLLATLLTGNTADDFVGPPAPAAAPASGLRIASLSTASLVVGSTLDTLVGPPRRGN